jgi:PKD repeat protein
VTYDGLKATFKATLTSNIAGVTGLSYRWDFGDGAAFTSFSASDTISHTYAQKGSYKVQVEIMDSIGNHVVAGKPVFTMMYLPLVGR